MFLLLIFLSISRVNSGAGTNLKVGTHVRRKAPKLFCCTTLLFGSTSTITRFRERFRGGKYSFLFAVLLRVPPCPEVYKSGRLLPVCALRSRRRIDMIMTGG